MPTVALTGTGTLTLVTGYTQSFPLRVVIYDDDLLRAPTSILVAVDDAAPGEVIRFRIDGKLVFETVAGPAGDLGPTSIPVSDQFLAGTHQLSAKQRTSSTGRATFTLTKDPIPYPHIVADDTLPVLIPQAMQHGVRHFVLQDLLPGGLGSYVMPISPATMSSPHSPREFVPHPTTALGGTFHMFEGSFKPHEWSLSGYCPDEDMYDSLVAFAELNRRFWVIDHRNRAWLVAPLGTELVTRRRQVGLAGVPTDWGHDYTMRLLILEPDWVAPQ